MSPSHPLSPSRGTQETMSSIFRCDPRPVHRGEITGTNTASYRRVTSIHGIHTRGRSNWSRCTYLSACVLLPPSTAPLFRSHEMTPQDAMLSRDTWRCWISVETFLSFLDQVFPPSFSFFLSPFSFFVFFSFFVQLTWWLGDCLGWSESDLWWLMGGWKEYRAS